MIKQLKVLTFLFFLGLSSFLISCKGEENKTKAHPDTVSIEKPTAKAKSRVEVIDFYGKRRCVTCKAIESSAKYTVDTYFAAEQKKGTVVLRVVNVEEEANYELAEKFEATGTALFLDVIKEGNERLIDLTEFAFAKGKDQEAFAQELKARIELELKAL